MLEGTRPESTAHVNTRHLEPAEGVGEQRDVGEAQPDKQLVREEYARLRSNVETSYKNLGNEVSSLSDALRAESTLLGSHGLFKLVSGVARALEGICHLEKGRLTSHLVKNSQLARSLDTQRVAIGKLDKSIQQLDKTLSAHEGKPLGALSGAEKAEVRARLIEVEKQADEFVSAINYFDADTEKRENRLAGLIRLVDPLYRSVNQYFHLLDSPADEPNFVAPEPDSDKPSRAPADLRANLDEYANSPVESVRRVGAILDGFLAGLESFDAGPSQPSSAKTSGGGAMGAEPVATPPTSPDRTTTQPPRANDLVLAAATPPRTTAATAGSNPATTPATLPPGAKLEYLEQEKVTVVALAVNDQFSDSKAYHNEITTGLLKGDDPLFYREKQNAEQCLKHSVNAFLGGAFLSTEDVAALYQDYMVDQQVNALMTNPKEAAAFARDFVGGDLDALKANPQKHVGDWMEMMRGAGVPEFNPDRIHLAGGLLELGRDYINKNHEQLDVPKAEITKFGRRAEERQVLDFVERKQGETDRMVIGASKHFQAFRKAENGQWYEVDSALANQRRRSPLEFMQGRFELERNVEGAMDVDTSNRFEFLTFDTPGYFEPRFRDTALMGQTKV